MFTKQDKKERIFSAVISPLPDREVSDDEIESALKATGATNIIRMAPGFISAEVSTKHISELNAAGISVEEKVKKQKI